jgi:hypothetical protein
MNHKRARENNINPKLIIPEFNSKLYLTKKRKTDFNVLKSNVIIDRINTLETNLKLANEKITSLHNENLLYDRKLCEIYSFLGISISPFYNHTNTYIS